MTIPCTTQSNCPNCHAEVEIHGLVSANFYGMTTDLRRMTSGANPFDYLISSCKNCGFTGHEDDFDETVDPDVATLIEQHIHPLVYDEQLQADTRWEFGARIAEWKGETPEHVADLYLNAAWCSNDVEKERYYRRKAAGWLERSIGEGVRKRPRIITLYLIGELYRRLEDIAVACQWFDAAIAEADRTSDGEQIRELAIQQKSNPKETI